MTSVPFAVDDQAILTRQLWAELVYLRARFTCEDCGARPYGDIEARPIRPKAKGHATLDAHHLNGDDRDHRLANGRCLCNTCHARVTMLGRVREMSPEWRAKMAGLDRSRPNSAAQKAQAAARMKARWKDPAYRAKMSAAISRGWEKRKAAA